MIYLILILLFLFPVYACDYKLWNYGNSYERGNTYKGSLLSRLEIIGPEKARI